MTGDLKMGVNVAAHTRHIFLGSEPPPPPPPPPGLSPCRDLSQLNVSRVDFLG